MFEMQSILDNELQSVAIVLFIVLFALVFKKNISKTIVSVCYKLIHLKWRSVDKGQMLGLLTKPLAWFLFTAVLVIVLNTLNTPHSWKNKFGEQSIAQLIYNLGVSLIIIFFTRLVLRFTDFVALVMETNANKTKDKTDNQIIVFFRDFLKVIFFLFGLLGVIRVLFNIDVSSVLTGLSIVGAALALAAKESIENIIASFIIFFDKPFFTGEVVKVNTIHGEVEEIGLRSTRIRTADHTLVTVPNKQMVDSVVDNWSKRDAFRINWKIELSHNNTSIQIEHLLNELSEQFKSFSEKSISSSIYLSDASKNAFILSIEIDFHSTDQQVWQQTKQALLLCIKRTMEKLTIKPMENNQSEPPTL